MSAFDPELFLNQETTEAIDTTIIPIPIGDWPAQVYSVKGRETQSKDGTETYFLLDVLWEILDEGVKETTGMDKPLCKHSIFIELTEEGSLDMSKGKNRQIGLLK